MTQKAISIIFKRFPLKQGKPTFFEGEVLTLNTLTHITL